MITLYSMQAPATPTRCGFCSPSSASPFNKSPPNMAGRDHERGIPQAEPERQGAAGGAGRRAHAGRSDAILTYFGEGTRFVPQDKYLRAKMFEWMFFEQNYHEGTIAVRGAILNLSAARASAHARTFG